MGISTRKARLIREGFARADEAYRMYRNLYLNQARQAEYRKKIAQRASKIYNRTTWWAFHRRIEKLSGRRRRLY